MAMKCNNIKILKCMECFKKLLRKMKAIRQKMGDFSKRRQSNDKSKLDRDENKRFPESFGTALCGLLMIKRITRLSL
jgi:hypothetical protein